MSLPSRHSAAVSDVTSSFDGACPESSEYLLCATNRSNLYALDIRTLEPLWTIHSPPRYGLVTAFVVDPNATWLLVSTARGILSVWDLRFRVAVKSWTYPGSPYIHAMRLALHPAAQNRWVWIVPGGRQEVTLWDVEKSMCRDVYANRAWDDIKIELSKAGGASAYEVVLPEP